jgi:hypothetical protein
MFSCLFSSKEPDNENNDLVLISIRIPPEMIDNYASDKQLSVDLTNLQTQFIMKAKFSKDMVEDYNRFDSRERIKAIINILSE